MRNIYLFIRKHTSVRELRVPSQELRRSEPYPGVGQDESHGCCVLCWGRLDAILFSPSLPSLFSPSISSAIFFLSASSFFVLPCLLSVFFSRFFLLIRSVHLSSPSFSALLLSPPPRPSSRARTRRAFRKRLSHVHMQASASCARICVGLYCVRWKVRRGNRWMRAYVSRIIWVYV